MKSSNTILLILAILIILGIAGIFYVTAFDEAFDSDIVFNGQNNTTTNDVLNTSTSNGVETTTTGTNGNQADGGQQNGEIVTTTPEEDLDLAQEDAEKIAERWVRNKSEVFEKDGENLDIVRSVRIPDCEKCFMVALKFDSKTYNEEATSGIESIEAHLAIVEIRQGKIERANTLGIKDTDKFEQLLEQNLEQQNSTSS